jgi:hypothetical protein
MIAKSIELVDDGLVFTANGNIRIGADGKAEFNDVIVKGTVQGDGGYFKGDIDIASTLTIIQDPGSLLVWSANTLLGINGGSGLLDRTVSGRTILDFFGQMVKYPVSGSCGYRLPNTLSNVGSSFGYGRMLWLSDTEVVRHVQSGSYNSYTNVFYQSTDGGQTWTQKGTITSSSGHPCYYGGYWYYQRSRCIYFCDVYGQNEGMLVNVSYSTGYHMRETSVLGVDANYIYFTGEYDDNGEKWMRCVRSNGQLSQGGVTVFDRDYAVLHFNLSYCVAVSKRATGWYFSNYGSTGYKIYDLGDIREDRCYCADGAWIVEEVATGAIKKWTAYNAYTLVGYVGSVQAPKYSLEAPDRNTLTVRPIIGASEYVSLSPGGLVDRIVLNGSDLLAHIRTVNGNTQVKQVGETTYSSITATTFQYRVIGSGTSQRVVFRLNDSDSLWGSFLTNTLIPVAGNMTISSVAKILRAFYGTGGGKLLDFDEMTADSITGTAVYGAVFN